LRIANSVAPLAIPLPDQFRVAREGFGCRQLYRIQIAPVAIFSTERWNPAFSRNTRACKNENTSIMHLSEDTNTYSKKIALLWARLYQSIAMQKCSFVLTLLTLFISGNFALSATDTPETRRHEAERYLQATPPKALFEDMAEKMAANLPPDQREQFQKLMTSQLDIAALTKAMIDSMVKHFTTEELKALADFYGSPVGKSAMQKFGAYMADIMPAMEAEIMKAQAKLNQSMPNQSPK